MKKKSEGGGMSHFKGKQSKKTRLLSLFVTN